METMNLEQIRALATPPEGLCVSIYTSTDHVSTNTSGNDIRFKNMLYEAEKLLAARQMDQRQVKEYLSPAWHLQEDKMYWQHQADGCAVFLGPDFFRTYRLPLAFPDVVTVSSRFHLKPLFELVAPTGHFYVLALSRGKVRVFQCTAYGAQELQVPDLPESLAFTLRFDETERERITPERQPSASRTAAGSQIGFHGHGAPDDREAKDLLRFCQEIDRALAKVLRHEQAPLVLAGVQEAAGLFRRASQYQYITDEIVSGNPDRLSGDDLRERAWRIVEPLFIRARRQAMDRFAEALAYDQGLSDPAEVALAANDALIETIFLPVNTELWGHLDPESRQVTLHKRPEPGDDDLLDVMAQQVLAAGGEVWVVPADELPQPTGVAATLRFRVPSGVLQT